MKIESIKSFKFEKFEDDKVNDLHKIVGGEVQNTTYKDSNGNAGCDTYEVGTDDGISVHVDQNGTHYDYYTVVCEDKIK